MARSVPRERAARSAAVRRLPLPADPPHAARRRWTRWRELESGARPWSGPAQDGARRRFRARRDDSRPCRAQPIRAERRVAHQDAAVTIDNNLFPILDLERAGAKANDHRKAE